MNAAAEAIRGTIQSIRGPYSGGFCIMEIPPHGAVCGVMPSDIRPGDHVLATGKWSDHPKYGKQFKVEQIQIEVPRDVQGIREYLDRHFKFVGPTRAKALIDTFGDRLFEVMEQEPEKLAQIQGITAERAKRIHEEYLAIKGDQQLDVFFASNGITPGLRNRLIDHYGSKEASVREVKDNPYSLADEMWGIGFKKADAIALRMGVKRDSHLRVRSGVRWILQEASNGEGHSFIPQEELLNRAAEILQVNDKDVVEAVHAGVREGHLIDHNGQLYHAALYRAETLVADRLRSLVTSHHQEMMQEIGPEVLQEMDEDQRKALFLALSSKVAVITGGPGVGKTFSINRIMQALGDRKIELAAPTGKAAKRMSEMTGRPAKTIHRLLEFNPFEGGFQRNHTNPIEADTVIIDETSMIDVRLMASLMDAVSNKTQILFVGDVDQLPSVGPGRVLADMIDAEVIPCAHLRTLHRQAAESQINLNARRINRGEKLNLTGNAGDFWFCAADEADKIPDLMVKGCRAVKSHFGFSFDDIQVLCPQKRSVIGAKDLNDKLRPVLNPEGQELSGVPYHVGDRVIQLKNNYKLGVFNGYIGRVKDADKDYLYVKFEDLQGNTEVAYPTGELEQLQLAYALTIHKSQGSEFPAVIIPVHTANFIMLKRNLLYTAVTRGRKLVVIIGSMKAINVAIRTMDSNKRYSNLKEFIRSGVPVNSSNNPKGGM